MVIPVPMRHFARRNHQQEPPETVPIVKIRKPARSHTRAQAVESALSGIFFVIDTPRFRSQLAFRCRAQASDKVFPDLPGSGLITLSQLVNPPRHWLVCMDRHGGCPVPAHAVADLSTARARKCCSESSSLNQTVSQIRPWSGCLVNENGTKVSKTLEYHDAPQVIGHIEDEFSDSGERHSSGSSPAASGQTSGFCDETSLRSRSSG